MNVPACAARHHVDVTNPVTPAPSTVSSSVVHAVDREPQKDFKHAHPTAPSFTQRKPPVPLHNAPAKDMRRPTTATKPPLPSQARGLRPTALPGKVTPADDVDAPTPHQQELMTRFLASPFSKAVDEESASQIMQQIVENACPVTFKDISGLQQCKQLLMEAVILPARRPELFTGIRKPCSGLLLFGPPGNGKTMLAKAVANECKTTFFNISASSITSKWVGDSEKSVRALFAVARAFAPSTIFIDEVDSLLQARGGSSEAESSRRLKTEFLVQMDGAGESTDGVRVLVMGATNRPFDLDDAALRRFQKRVLVPLPDKEARLAMLTALLGKIPNNLTLTDWEALALATDTYSGNDLKSLCEDVAMAPIRELGTDAFSVDVSAVRPVNINDAMQAMHSIRPSASGAISDRINQWNEEFGSKR